MRLSRVRARLGDDAPVAIGMALLVLLAAVIGASVTLAAWSGGLSAVPEPTAGPPGTTNTRALAGVIVRVRQGAEVGDLRITQMSAPDPSGAPYARCLLRRPAAERIVNFDLDWTAMDLGLRGTAPAIRVTIMGPGNAPVTAQVATGSAGGLGCRPVNSLSLASQPTHAGIELLLTVALPPRTPLSGLSVWIDGHPIRARLVPVCPGPGCFRGFPDNPVLFKVGTPYSLSLRLLTHGAGPASVAAGHGAPGAAGASAGYVIKELMFSAQHRSHDHGGGGRGER